MSSPQPPQKPPSHPSNMPTPGTPPPPPKTILGSLTQAVQTMYARVDFSKLMLKPNARVPELRVQDGDSPDPAVYPLLGDRYVLGRSSKSCDIVIRNPVVSQIHLSISRDSRQKKAPFVVKDENSTNGVYLGRRRVASLPLRDGDVLTLGPPELANAVQVRYSNPPPWYVKTLRYSLYGFTGVTALTALWVAIEWQRFQVRPLPQSVQGPVAVYSRDNQPLVPEAPNRAHLELKSLSEFSPYLPDAVIASEDSRYYWHLGVDPIGTLRALLTNIRGGEIREGGSTITQQLARSIYRDYVGTEDSAARKLREAVVALKLETYHSKDYLMLTYLNRVFLGGSNFGFEDASRFYFGKSARELTLSEAATLVGILPAPNSFNPVRDYSTAVEYRDRVLNRMVALGKVSAEEAQRARRSRIEINPEAIKELESTRAPYFYSQVFLELEELLGTQLAREGNFIVESTVDLSLQPRAEAALVSALDTDGAALGYSQGAIVTLDSRSGEVLALVGGRNYQESQFNRATQALRQPGSTFKVFAYTAALEQGTSPGAAYSCSPLVWEGQQYAGCRSGGGAMDMYSGLALSENVVALRIAQDAGLGEVVRMAREMGIDSDLNAVPGLILGQSEVTLMEMTGAFATYANNGVGNRPHTIRRILDSSDCQNPDDRSTCRVIYDYERDAEADVQVLDPAIAQTMTTLLQGVVSSGTGRNAYLGVGEAGKTGTTNDNVDLWFVGYVPRYSLTTGVWLGNDEIVPTSGSSAQAAQLWGDYMNRILP